MTKGPEGKALEYLDFQGTLMYTEPMDNKKMTSNAEDVVVLSRAEYESMKAQMQWMAEQLLHANQRTYGTSSEKADESLIEQMSLLFNEAERSERAHV